MPPKRTKVSDLQEKVNLLRAENAELVRKVRNSDMLIENYQREHIAFVETCNYLAPILADLVRKPRVDLSNASGPAIRSALRRFVRGVDPIVNSYRESQSKKARKQRDRDPLAPLLRRTLTALRVRRKRSKPLDVIRMLGEYDYDGILRECPDACSSLSNNAEDPPTPYHDRKARLIYWHDGSQTKCTSEADIRKRLGRATRTIKTSR